MNEKMETKNIDCLNWCDNCKTNHYDLDYTLPICEGKITTDKKLNCKFMKLCKECYLKFMSEFYTKTNKEMCGGKGMMYLSSEYINDSTEINGLHFNMISPTIFWWMPYLFIIIVYNSYTKKCKNRYVQVNIIKSNILYKDEKNIIDYPCTSGYYDEKTKTITIFINPLAYEELSKFDITNIYDCPVFYDLILSLSHELWHFKNERGNTVNPVEIYKQFSEYVSTYEKEKENGLFIKEYTDMVEFWLKHNKEKKEILL